MKESFIYDFDFASHKNAWDAAEPFSHIVLDKFLCEDIATQVAREFPEFDSSIWRDYCNAIEVKKLTNHWDAFGPVTYRLFQFLNSSPFVEQLENLTGCELFPDFGLNGGGLHTHKSGGKLNAHLDYSIHPKLRLERRVNVLIYVTPEWNEDWGGLLGLWDKDPEKNAPGRLVKSIVPAFNRAVIFDTTQNSWHGLPQEIVCPENVTRNSLAVYYMCLPRGDAPDRGKALFAPSKDQENNPEILELIDKRSRTETARSVYGDKKTTNY